MLNCMSAFLKRSYVIPADLLIIMKIEEEKKHLAFLVNQNYCRFNCSCNYQNLHDSRIGRSKLMEYGTFLKSSNTMTFSPILAYKYVARPTHGWVYTAAGTDRLLIQN